MIPNAEAAVPYAAFKSAGFDVSFATEAGKSPHGDKLLLEGLTQKLLVGTHNYIPIGTDIGT